MGNYYEKLGLQRTSCASRLTIPNMTGTTPNAWRNNTDTTYSKPIRQVVPLISLIHLYPPYCFDLHLPSLFLIDNCSIIAEYKVQSGLSISPCHDHGLTQSTDSTAYSIHRVQHQQSTPSSEYSIQRVQHPTKIVCLPFILMIMSGPLNVASASGMPPYKINCHQPALHQSSKVKSPRHIPTIASSCNQLMNRVWIPGAPPINQLQVLLQSHSIMGSKCISKNAKS